MLGQMGKIKRIDTEPLPLKSSQLSWRKIPRVQFTNIYTTNPHSNALPSVETLLCSRHSMHHLICTSQQFIMKRRHRRSNGLSKLLKVVSDFV